MDITGICKICGTPSRQMHTCKLCGNIVCKDCSREDICSLCIDRHIDHRNVCI